MFLIPCFLFGISSLKRDWEQWDRGRVAQVIDAFWLSSKEEVDHRKALAALVKQWSQPNDHFLEIGCGSGLVYGKLVPDIFSNHAYVGVDISNAMLDIARKRFPKGTFFKDDLYALSFPDNSFEITAAFEVFGHLGDIEKPILEMFRTSSRLMIFTVWTGPKTKVEQEIIEDATFIHKTFSQEEIFKAIDQALKFAPHTTYSQSVSKDITAYIVVK